ncbi:MAG: hypothetical protein ACRDBO_09515 [Lachnospiraceae bacterium]
MKKVKEMLPFLTAIAISYFIFLSLLLLIGEMESGCIIMFIVNPLLCLAFSIAYGINNSLNVLYAVLVAILFAPSMLIFTGPMWGFVIGYGIVALVGNAIGMIFYKHNIRIKSIGKIGRYLIRAVIGSYIIAVIVSAIMITQMNQITYSSTAYGVTIKEVSIDFASNTATRSYYDYYGELVDFTENPISSSKKMQIKTVCAISLIPIWQEYYHNPWVLDGDNYYITKGYESSESVFYGSNAYPLTHWFVYWIIHGAIE